LHTCFLETWAFVFQLSFGSLLFVSSLHFNRQ